MPSQASASPPDNKRKLSETESTPNASEPEVKIFKQNGHAIVEEQQQQEENSLEKFNAASLSPLNTDDQPSHRTRTDSSSSSSTVHKRSVSTSSGTHRKSSSKKIRESKVCLVCQAWSSDFTLRCFTLASSEYQNHLRSGSGCSQSILSSESLLIKSNPRSQFLRGERGSFHLHLGTIQNTSETHFSTFSDERMFKHRCW
jgi:hypothetical protein